MVFLLSEAFFEERSSTFCSVLSARSAVWVVGMVAENLFSGKHGCYPYHWAQPMTKRFLSFFLLIEHPKLEFSNHSTFASI
jgi:hypothetical protein